MQRALQLDSRQRRHTSACPAGMFRPRAPVALANFHPGGGVVPVSIRARQQFGGHGLAAIVKRYHLSLEESAMYNPANFRLDEGVALITGAGAGIGRAVHAISGRWSHPQHILDGRRKPEPAHGGLRRIEGRREPSHAQHRLRPWAHEYPRERDRAGLADTTRVELSFRLV
jgi:hypothetical protein